MRVIFMGTPHFAVPSLRALIAGKYEIAAVFTQPDRPAGRGQKPHASPVKELALEQDLAIHQPERVRAEEHRSLLDGLNPDFIVVVAYGQILPGWLLRSARIAPVNVHGSLLPKYRGAAPVIWALLNGERTTGITTMLMDEQLDTGPILLKREVHISEAMTAGELAQDLSRLGAEILIPTLEGLSDKTLRPVPQDNIQASWAPRVSKQQAEIKWNSPSREIHNRIRAFNPRPLAYTELGGVRLQLLQSRVAGRAAEPGGQPGRYLGKTDTGMLIQCGGGTVLEVLKLQAANRRPVSGREFANGARISSGTMLFHAPGLNARIE